MRFPALALLAALLAAPALFAADVTLLRGTVRDSQDGRPVTGATVYLEGTQTQTLTDAKGRFELAAPRGAKVVVVVYLSGLGAQRKEVSTQGETLEVDIPLALASVSDTITVQAAPLPPAESPIVVRPLEVVQTAGTEADVFRLLRTYPGVVQEDEGAGLFVRGGDSSEVLVLLDGAPIAHPYRYETPTGGYSGFTDPFMLRGISFSTGGFPARFGDALSAVVELDGSGPPTSRQATVTAGLAGVSASLAYPSGEGWGARFAGNLATPRPLFEVNGGADRFSSLPGGSDLSFALYRQTPYGPLKLFGLQQSDDVGVLLEGEGFKGFLDTATRQRLLIGRGDSKLGDWRLKSSFGGGDYRSSTTAGVLGQQSADHWLASRVELSRGADGQETHLGLDADWTRSSISGQVPVHGGDFGGNGGVIPYLVDRDDRHAGLFGDTSWTWHGLSTQAGLRVDRFAAEGTWTADPRLAVSHPFAGGKLRAAWGLYHQEPQIGYFDEVGGARHLPPMEAEHFVAGYERGTASHGLLRVEAYRKEYRRLPLQDPVRGFNANGYGSAQGLDVFGDRTFEHGELRASYSYLRARRRWTAPADRDRFPLPAGTWEPDFSIPHSLQLVGSYQGFLGMSLGFSWRMATGRPFTPILGAEPAGEGFLPIYGTINSERLPPYERLDLTASRPLVVAGTSVLVFVGLNNVLNRLNVFQYTYSADFSVRRPLKNASPRTFYVGFSILDLWRKT